MKNTECCFGFSMTKRTRDLESYRIEKASYSEKAYF